MFTQPTQLIFDIPAWFNEHCRKYKATQNITDKMLFVIEASLKNIKYGTGGPFAAAVFNIDTDDLISLGTNLVTTQNISMLHAEMVALSLAQKKIGSYDISSGSSKYLLVSSSEPCAMCLGALGWSGIKQLATGAKEMDIRSIGFDEGDKIFNWKESLEKRGIKVIPDVKRAEAADVLKQYIKLGGKIYNPSHN